MSTWEPRPLPDVTPETEPYWRRAAEGRLLVQECYGCGSTIFYPRSHCPHCFDTDVRWKETSGAGTVYTYSVSERVEGWPEAALPLVLAYVELEEGPRMLTTLSECTPDEVDVGMDVEVRFVPTECDEIAVPEFVPAEA